MGSITDSIPPEILKEVFGYIEAWLDQQVTEKYFREPHHSIAMPLSVPRTLPSTFRRAAPPLPTFDSYRGNGRSLQIPFSFEK